MLLKLPWLLQPLLWLILVYAGQRTTSSIFADSKASCAARWTSNWHASLERNWIMLWPPRCMWPGHMGGGHSFTHQGRGFMGWNGACWTCRIPQNFQRLRWMARPKWMLLGWIGPNMGKGWKLETIQLVGFRESRMAGITNICDPQAIARAVFLNPTPTEVKSIEGADFTDTFFRQDQINYLCGIAKGTNPTTKVSTRESLGCPE